MACEIARRPAGAPHFGDLARAVRAVRREGGRLVVSYDAGARERLAELERLVRLAAP